MSAVLRILPVLLCFASVVSSLPVRAADEVQLEGHDLRIRADWRWVGGDSGGYYPLRIEAVNNGDAREITFAFDCGDGGYPGARRTMRLEAGAQVRFTLLIPLARERSSGKFVVSSAGERLEGLERSITLPDVDPGDIRPAILVVSRQAPDLGALERALYLVHQIWSASSAPDMFPAASASLGMSWVSRQSNHQIVSPETLPDSWLAYTTVDMAVISREDFSALSAGHRRAILDWTAGGGTLIVTATAGLPGDDPALRELLGQSGGGGWVSAERRHQPRIEVSESLPADEDPRRPLEPPTPEEEVERVLQGERVNWRLDPTPFAIRRSGLGQIAVVVDDPFAAGPRAAVAEDWLWLLLSLPMHDLSWTQRYGGAARVPDSRFLMFLIPGQRSVPVGAMLVLVTLFTLAIGPLNYFLAWHRRRLSLLLITVPGFAAGTTVLLFLYALVAFGFTTQARIRSLTVVDQGNQTAVSLARVSLYAPFAPAGGPAFPADAAVLPIHGPGGTPRLDSVDWSERQQFGPGWLPSRTRIQFQTVVSHPERRRLEIRPSGGGGLSLSNGFEVGLKAVLVADDRGAVFLGRAVAAGGTAELQPADDVARRGFLRDWQESIPELPDDLDPELVQSATAAQTGFFGPRRRRRPQLIPASAPGLLEDVWSEHARLIESDLPLPPRTFLAVLEANPGVSTGVSRVVERGSIHVLQGSY